MTSEPNVEPIFPPKRGLWERLWDWLLGYDVDDYGDRADERP